MNQIANNNLSRIPSAPISQLPFIGQEINGPAEPSIDVSYDIDVFVPIHPPYHGLLWFH